MKRLIWVMLLAGIFGTGPLLAPPPGTTFGAALADDGDDGGDDGGDGGDDGDDGGDDDGGDDSDGGSGERGYGSGGGPGQGARRSDGGQFLQRILPGLFGPRERQATRPARRTPAPAPRDVAASDEIVVVSLSPEDLTVLENQGFSVIEERQFATLGTTARRLRIPAGTGLDAARDLVRAVPTGEDADLNHYYRTEQGFDPACTGLECPIRTDFGWPLPETRARACGAGLRIGLVDTGLNPDHDTFEGAALTVLDFKPLGDQASRALHGTAVAALLIGRPGTRSPGLVPRAEVIAIDPFHRRGADERADVFSLMDAMDRVAQQDVDVMNLSLAGPPNTSLETLVRALFADRDIVIVAAAGNEGPRSEPLYPAAIEEVIAVTAVDRDRNVYRRAVQGPHIDLAAPGVAVWTAASISGARWKTGTSFATPFVTAAAGLLRLDNPDLPNTMVVAGLKQNAIDLGDAGDDVVFGAGLSPAAGPDCRLQPPEAELLPVSEEP